MALQSARHWGWGVCIRDLGGAGGFPEGARGQPRAHSYQELRSSMESERVLRQCLTDGMVLHWDSNSRSIAGRASFGGGILSLVCLSLYSANGFRVGAIR